MEWIRSGYNMLNKQPRALMGSTMEECDPQACYDSFKEHWHQALKIINRTQQLPKNDDVLGVVNHLEQMVTLLLYDMKKIDQLRVPISSSSQCLEYMLAENILDKLFEWGVRAGKFKDAVRCEQLKLYEVLISRSRHVLLVHEPFLRPMLKLLNSCKDELFSRDIEKLLVDLLNQLCALLMQNVDLIDLFFQKNENNSRFIIFLLLIPFVHREDSIGMRARDGLLLCMSLSKKNKDVATYIVERSNFAVLAASGLNGLYSLLPNILDDISVPDWRRLTPDDVNDIKGLSTFVTSLEFSNAVAQVAHPMIRKQLQEFLFRGFLIPVLGPALLQTNTDEQVAATAYLELILRTVTQPGLLYALLKFLINMDYDGQRLLNILIQRINSASELCLVSLSLFETMVNLNCEDMMLELVFQHLQPCLHLMLSQRRMLLPLDPHCQSFEKLLNLAPTCCDLPTSPRTDNIHWNHYGGQQSLCGKYHAYLYDARNKIASCQAACQSWNNSYTGCDEILQDPSNTENCNSLSSLGESSGYESLKIKIDDSDEIPVWQISSNKVKKSTPVVIDNDHLNSSGSAGLFLTILLEKLKNFLSNSFYINLHVTGLISRLAVYPQPLLRTYLLDDSLVLQPNVPSLFQIIGSLKQSIDEYMNRRSDSASLIRAAKDFLVDRETRLINARRNTLEKSSSFNMEPEPFQRNEPKRRSLNLPSFTKMLGRRPSQVAENSVAMVPTEEYSCNLLYPKFNEAQHVALCAVLLDEWVKELAALAQEHTIAQLAALFK
ncbi:FHIP family protein AGAP011705 isoform X2 [Tribolium madens]|uniref:FHIP family protein AGAP011705 isoform X2 n=1 Tax=Tribolium madens TaxID=41895 RepID=UPI001CF754A3|nr:FHIP family protein AGAP011705 isoform X2 [Tribolium madens]